PRTETPAWWRALSSPLPALELPVPPGGVCGIWQRSTEPKPGYGDGTAPGPRLAPRGSSGGPGPDSQKAPGARLHGLRQPPRGLSTPRDDGADGERREPLPAQDVFGQEPLLPGSTRSPLVCSEPPAGEPG